MLRTDGLVNPRTYLIGRLPARYSPVVFAFFMSSIMAFLMCLVITAANHNLTVAYLKSEYFSGVLHAYKLAMPVAFMCVLAVRPLVVKLVALCVKNS
ncbi:MAG: DUF2798 domain-containing protein [Gammaproteobacteria bacterium]|nr:MAG: DUF2798 domain-containing protein [Gammaproteobacteria bacterium]